MKRKGLVSLLAILLVLAVAFTGCSQKGYPNKTITIVVASAAGGGTDLGNRALGAAMEKPLGVKVNVVNVPSGGGSDAANQVWSAAHDGYTLIGFFEGIFSFAVTNAHPTTSKDWEYYILGGTPGVMSVAPDSPYNSAQDVIDAMKKNPGQIKLANSSVGCIWDIKAALLQSATGVDYKFMPYQGSNPSILACMNGEVDVIITGLGEQSEYLAAKKLKPLAMIELTDMVVPGYDTPVPSIVKTVPDMANYLPLDQTIGFAVPSDAPADVKAALDKAFKTAIETTDVKNYTESKYVKISGASGADSKKIAENNEKVFSWILYDKGVAPVSPEQFGIARP